MLIKSFPFQVKVDMDKREFEGYASTFGNIDLQSDVVTEGAFAKTIKERLPKNLIKVLWQHWEPLGLPVHMEEDSKGLLTVSKVSRTTLGNDALNLMADGVVDRMSIGFDLVKDERDREKNIRYLKEVKLYEYSPVTFAANEEAMITAVKSMKSMADLQALLPFIQIPAIKGGKAHFSSTAEATDYDIDRVKAAIVALQALLKGMEPDSSTPDSGKPPMVPADQIDPEFQSILKQMQEFRKNLLGG